MIKLFAVGFPRDMGEIELLEMFSIHGTVNNVTIITDQETGMSQGYGFITMTDQAGADRAINALNGASIGERVLSVRLADRKNGPQTPPAPPAPQWVNASSGNFRRPNTNTNNSNAPQPAKKKRPRRPLS